MFWASACISCKFDQHGRDPLLGFCWGFPKSGVSFGGRLYQGCRGIWGAHKRGPRLLELPIALNPQALLRDLKPGSLHKALRRAQSSKPFGKRLGPDPQMVPLQKYVFPSLHIPESRSYCREIRSDHKLQAPDTESRSLLAELVQVRAPPHRCYAGGVCTGLTGLLNFAVMVTDCFSGLRVSAAHQGVESIWASQAEPPKAAMGSNSPWLSIRPCDLSALVGLRRSA